jgi:heparosan-N-sulfate-glucuronate 5-epimerase
LSAGGGSEGNLSNMVIFMRYALSAIIIVGGVTLWACDRHPTEYDPESGALGTDPSFVSTGSGGTWPAIPFDPRFRTAVNNALNTYRPNDHIRFLSDGYSPTGQYLNFWHQRWGESDVLKFDAEGVPQVKYNDVFYDHPVTLCRYALHLHGRIVRGEPDLEPQFFRVVDRLLGMQDDRGAFLYPFAYRLYGHQFQPGWASGMAQGMGLSVLRRAHSLRPEVRFIQAGNRAVIFLNRPKEHGGVKTTLADLHPSLGDYLWLEEFATTPANYKLNGFMFTLIGLYDWWQRNPTQPTGSVPLAGELFRSGVVTVENTLAYFDVRGFTATDLRYIVEPGRMPNVSTTYHRVHIYQLHTLSEITGSSTLKSYEKLWRWYVGDVS